MSPVSHDHALIDGPMIPNRRTPEGIDRSPSRWIATISYTHDSGPVKVVYDFEELFELHDLVEHGPDWNAIESIVVKLNPARRRPVTVEEAREL